jgi:hypothetical protein
MAESNREHQPDGVEALCGVTPMSSPEGRDSSFEAARAMALQPST